jgi:hypothetical protein
LRSGFIMRHKLIDRNVDNQKSKNEQLYINK